MVILACNYVATGFKLGVKVNGVILVRTQGEIFHFLAQMWHVRRQIPKTVAIRQPFSLPISKYSVMNDILGSLKYVSSNIFARNRICVIIFDPSWAMKYTATALGEYLMSKWVQIMPKQFSQFRAPPKCTPQGHYFSHISHKYFIILSSDCSLIVLTKIFQVKIEV